MKRRGAPAVPFQEAGAPQADLLPATVAHELNNIAASLRGFAQLARDAAGRDNALAEIDLGVQRLASLADDLSAFARHPTVATVVALEDCVGGAEWDEAPPLRWECERRIPVLADAEAAQRAIGVMTRLAAHTGRALVVHVGNAAQDPAAPVCCLHCAAPCNAAAVWITLPMTSGQPRFGTRSAPGRDCLTLPELRYLALARAAHFAGGHLVSDSAPEGLALVLLQPTHSKT